MAQSFTRKIQRMNLIPVWNKVTFNFDFYKRIKSSGRYAITPNPYGDYPVKGPGISYERVLALQKANEYTPEEPGLFKRMFGKLLGKK